MLKQLLHQAHIGHQM